MLSIIVPTFNERENVQSLIPAIAQVLRGAAIDFEVVVVDDASPDGTADAVRALAADYPARVLVRENERGLSSAAVHGFRAAGGEILTLMDADHSHPPGTLPAMHEAIADGAMLVVGSRHVAGGGSRDWPLYRRVISDGARLLARGVTPIRDSTSGFLMFRREVLDTPDLVASGFKIGLELMVKGRHDGKLCELPIEFTDRLHGESKLGGAVAAQYLRQLVALYAYRLSGGNRRD